MINILIVDDKPENSYLLESLLKGNGYITIPAKNGKEALKIAKKNEFALIISDILMPVMDGFTFCRECKKDEALKNIPFIFYSATYTSQKDEEFALSLGADKFIFKPQDPDVFIEIINEVLKEVKEKNFQFSSVPDVSEEIVLKEYNSALIRKLEDKMAQAEEAEKELRKINDELKKEIEERKRVENELRKLSMAVEQSPASIMITDKNGNIEYVNPKLIEITGYELNEIIGKNPRIFSSGEQSKGDYKILWDTIISGKEWRGELHNKKKNGGLYWVSASISPILNEHGVITNLIALEEDITEHKMILKDLIVAKEKAEQSDELKTEFLAQMSHEIRTPMNAIISFTSLLKDDYFENLTDDLSVILNSISSAGRRIIRTVDLILDSSEMQIGTYYPTFSNIDLENKILHVIQSEYSALAKQKGLHFSFQNNSPSTVIYGDDYSINQIFVNLIDNAIKYTDAGKVDVLIDKNKDNNIYVAVSDTGIGISDDYLSHLFQPFMQEQRGYSRRYEGNGLGLSLVKKYCELNGMIIDVESEKNVGSKFTVTFTKNK